MVGVGAKLQQLRQRRGLGTRDLAARAGVSHSTISLIERDRVSPSINTLAAIVEALGTTLIGFLSDLQHGVGISPFYRAADLPEIGDRDATGVSYHVVGINHPNRQLLMLHERYEPRADTRGTIIHPAQEAGIVLAGRVEVTVGAEVATLDVGDAYYFDSSVPHKFRNAADGRSEIVSAVTPPSF